MPRISISDKTIQLIKKLYDENLPVIEIARKVNVSYPIVWEYTKAKERGFKSYSKYREYLVKKRGFESLRDYNEDLARQRGFASYIKYRKYLVKKRGFKSLRDYNEDLVRQRGFKSLRDYNEDLVRQRGFKSLNEYQNYLARRRQKRPENRELSDLIKRSLKKLGKNQSWLASQIDVSRESVSKYAQGKRTPYREKLKRLFSSLNVPYRTLDDLL